MSCSQPDRLLEAMRAYPGAGSCSLANDMVQVNFDKSTAPLEALNSYCFQQGITLTHLVLKKKRLEERFFELTGNPSHE
jgi:ABC-2 type transport system ATP-binding protein